MDAQSRWTPWLALLLLVAALVHLPVLDNDFSWDDRAAAMGRDGDWVRPEILELQAPQAYFVQPYWPARQIGDDKLWRPVTVLSFALRHAVAGDDPRLAHALNLALLLLGIVLAWRVLRALGAPEPGPLIGATIFALHAVHSEVVAGVVGRSELLGFCFGFGALLLFLRALDREGRARLVALAGCALSLFLAFASKESTLAFVVFIPLFAWARKRLGRSPEAVATTPRRLAEGAALLLPAVAALSLRAVALAGARGNPITWMENPLAGEPWTVRIPNALWTSLHAQWLTIAPFDLAADWGPALHPVLTPADPRWWIAVVAGLGWLAAIVWLVRRRRERPLWLLAAACWFGFFFVVSNVPFAVNLVMAERTLFVPSLALSLLALPLVERLRREPELRGVATIALAAWLGASAASARERCGIWHDNKTLIEHEVLARPDNVRMRICMAHLCAVDERWTEALHHLDRAVELAPDHGWSWHDRGWILQELGRDQDAVECFRQAIAGRNDDPTWKLRAHCKLARSLFRLGRDREALGQAAEALRIHRLVLDDEPDLAADLRARATGDDETLAAMARKLLAVGAPASDQTPAHPTPSGGPPR
ncbi:MAG: tetratricopeptide repeat protein [Planctomycetota bacterium]